MNQVTPEDPNQITQEELGLFTKLLFPYQTQKRQEVLERQTRFVHYTTSDAAMNWFRSKSVWMRNTSTMNDFMEVEHGFECLRDAYADSEIGTKFKELLEKIAPGFTKEFEDLFNSWMPSLRSGTYISCMSEHLDSEDKIGRLSMWRAYGSSSAVALVFHNTPFFSESDALKVYSYPVQYLDGESFKAEFKSIVQAMEENIGLLLKLSKINKDWLTDWILKAFQSFVLCTKHPGFHEEKEWRIVHSPQFGVSEYLKDKIVSIRGIPQRIKEIPLKNVPEAELEGIELPEIIERVIIGPSEYAKAQYDAFVELMTEAGIKDAASKVFISNIPIR